MYALPLNDKSCANSNLVGNKAATLHRLWSKKITIPKGICLTKDAYYEFVQKTGIHDKILIELSRKDFRDMRWEEIWDASLRIRNIFVKESIPQYLKNNILTALKTHLPEKTVVVRSSSNAEDTKGSSFAGIHESFVNIQGYQNILKNIKLVWASLWSDAALSYQKELKLSLDKSFMSVIIQELISGTKSGIAFALNPNNESEAIIEAVYGLNKGLVDGDVEPDRWFVDRKNAKITNFTYAKIKRKCVKTPNGTKINLASSATKDKPVLSKNEVKNIFKTLMIIESSENNPQDIEWTIRKNKLFLLQSRPITTSFSKDKDSRRAWDLSLRRSFENLNALSVKIEKYIVPKMIEEAEQVKSVDLKGIADKKLAEEVRQRRSLYEKWKKVYWDDLIPFGHGVRIFAQAYNNKMSPDDPYEFIDLISTKRLNSIKRNNMLNQLVVLYKKDPRAFGKNNSFASKAMISFLEKFGQISCDINKCEDQKQTIINLIKQMSKKSDKSQKRYVNTKRLTSKYFKSFEKNEQNYAENLLELARKSYKMRDDDNIYLGRFESLLLQALQESKRRLGKRCKDNKSCENIEEVTYALRFPAYRPQTSNTKALKSKKEKISARQLKGQPAGPGIAKGYARVILNTSDLAKIKKNEILVSDSIDPNMTFVIPIVSGIIERRGGMLIHGAIIAREYGIPCVTGIPQATDFINTGDYLTLDGYYGVVTIEKRR